MTIWRRLIVIFMLIATHFWSILKFYINIFRNSTQLSSSIILAKHHLNATECWVLPFYFYVHIGLFQLALRAIWINLSKKQFSNNAQRRYAWDLKTKEAVPQLPHHSFEKFFVNWNRFVFQATPKLWSISENMSKNHQVRNNFGPRSPTVGGRGRPPFVENIANSHMPHCLSLVGSGFTKKIMSRAREGPLVRAL